MDDKVRHGIAIARAHGSTLYEIADDHGISVGTVQRHLSEDSELQVMVRAESERLRSLAGRQRALILLRTGQYRQNLDAMADDPGHPKCFDANKLMLSYAIGTPIERHESRQETTHRMADDQFEALRDSIDIANRSRGAPIEVASLLTSGKAAIPTPEVIAKADAEAQGKPANGGG